MHPEIFYLNHAQHTVEKGLIDTYYLVSSNDVGFFLASSNFWIILTRWAIISHHAIKGGMSPNLLLSCGSIAICCAPLSSKAYTLGGYN